jgi:RNA polymerase sigma-70 factor (ECF subfamily)
MVIGARQAEGAFPWEGALVHAIAMAARDEPTDKPTGEPTGELPSRLGDIPETASSDSPSTFRRGQPTIIEGVSSDLLVSRLREGDRHAFGMLYRTLYDTLWRLALVLARSPNVAEEVVQDVFVRLWTRHATLDIHVDIRVYLYAAVRNRVNDLARHGRLVLDLEQVLRNVPQDVPATSSPIPSPAFSLDERDFQAAYKRALRALTDRERAAVLLRWEEELTFEQLGHALGVSTVGARAIVLRAQKKVQTALGDYRR